MALRSIDIAQRLALSGRHSAAATSPESSLRSVQTEWAAEPCPAALRRTACISALWPLSCPQRARVICLPSVANQFEAAKIFEDRNRAAAEYFDAFLRGRLVAVGQVADRAHGAVGELERCNDVVHAVLAGIADGLALALRPEHAPARKQRKSTKWQTSPRMRPPPCSGSFTQ